MHAILGPQLFQTVFATDCKGRVRETIATSVSELENGTGISFKIRSDVRYSDGTAVTAKSVVDEWNRTLTPAIPVDSIRASSPQTIYLYSKLSPDSLRLLLTDPAFVVRSSRDSKVVGTGAYRIATTANEQSLRLEAVVSDTLPNIFVLKSSDDLRDLLPNSVQLGLTTDPSVVDYAASLPGLSVREVATGPTYLLVSRARLDAIRTRPPANVLLSVDPEFKTALANTAVRSLAGAYPTAELRGVPDFCDLGRSYPGPAAMETPVPAARLVFAAGDETARDIAERLSALQQTFPDGAVGDNIGRLFPGFKRGDKPVVPSGLAENELEESLRQGSDAAYVIRLTGSPVAQCLGLENLIEGSAWLREGFSASPLFAVPLLQTRQFLVAATADVPGLYLDGYGRVELDPSIYR